MGTGRGSSPFSMLDFADDGRGQLPEPSGRLRNETPPGATEPARTRAEPPSPGMKAIESFIETRVTDGNRPLLEDAIRRLKPIIGRMARGDHRLAPESELDTGHMVRILSDALGITVEKVIAASPSSFRFPEWLTEEERASLFEQAVLPGGRWDLETLAQRMQDPCSPTRRHLPANEIVWPDSIQDLRDAVETAMGESVRFAPQHLDEAVYEAVVHYLDHCVSGNASAARLLAPLIDRLPQHVPIRSLDEDGRIWLIRVA